MNFVCRSYSNNYVDDTVSIVQNVVSNLESSVVSDATSLDNSVASSVLNTFENLLNIQTIQVNTNSSSSINSTTSSKTVDTLNTVGQLLLVDAIIGEIIAIESDTLSVGSSRFDVLDPQCPSTKTYVQLSSQFVENYNVDDGQLDCIIQTQQNNIYDLSNSSNSTKKSISFV